jgi:hypothetical protein
MSKGKAPKAPDYAAAARETAAGNADAARIGAKANRVDQYTPYGSMTYYNPTSNNFNQSGYDAAMQSYQTQLSKYNAGGQPQYQGTGFNRTLGTGHRTDGYGTDCTDPRTVHAGLRSGPMGYAR